MASPKCQTIEGLLLDPTYSFLQNVLLIITGSTLLAIGVLLQQFVRHRIVVHGNLLLLFANIVFSCFANTFATFACHLRYKILLLIYTDPCQLLTPFWLVVLLHAPMGFGSFAYPAFHFCVMAERYRATFLADKYELEGQRFGFWAMLIIWPISFAYLAFIDVGALVELGPEPQGVHQLSSQYSNGLIFGNVVLNLLLVAVTAIGDWHVTVLNRRLREHRYDSKSESSDGYSLSRNYQLQENVLAMRLILPMDVCYALLYALFIMATIWLRTQLEKLSHSQYTTYDTLSQLVLFSYATISIVVYIRFIRFMAKCKRRSPCAITSAMEHGKVYFKQLEAQWQ